MKLKINSFKAVAMWKWDTSAEPHQPYRYTAKGANWMDEDEDDEEVCGICRLAFENCCPECKLPGDDCPLSECGLPGAGGACALARLPRRHDGKR